MQIANLCTCLRVYRFQVELCPVREGCEFVVFLLPQRKASC